jgi:hypothetical protein
MAAESWNHLPAVINHRAKDARCSDAKMPYFPLLDHAVATPGNREAFLALTNYFAKIHAACYVDYKAFWTDSLRYLKADWTRRPAHNGRGQRAVGFCTAADLR